MADTTSTTPRDARPLRILHLVNCSDAGGLSRYVFDLCSAMHSAGHEVRVAGSPGAWHWLFESAPWPWINVPTQGWLAGLWRSAHLLRAHLAQHPVDIIHAHYRRATLVGRRLQSAGNPPLLYTLHLSHISLNWPRNLFTDFGDHVHVASADAARWLEGAVRMPADRITTIPHGIDTARFKVATGEERSAARQRLGLSPDAPVAAYVGRFDDPKNEDWILDLAAATRGVLPDLRLLLVGEGPHENHLRQRIDRENLRDRVQLVPRCDPLSVYHAIDALLLPSTREGYSLVCAEAMSTGVPVLRTKTSGTSELILQNVTGRSVEIDHDAFIRASIEFLSNRDELRQMGAAAADHIRSHFTFDQQVQRTIELYRKMTTPSRKS
ncbi:MAG: glycosyltransferase family 4 protein [Phycisphaerales bacterium]|nr:glycosyltransferase family 4 protein [Phycisphaerales bacterium]